MHCFIHYDKEAVATCKKCGKAMCENCSAYSGHSGICPVCRRDEFVAEKNGLTVSLNKKKKWFNGYICLAVLDVVLFVLMIASVGDPVTSIILLPLLVYALLIFKNVRSRAPMKKRLQYLEGEIDKLNRATQIGAAEI